LPPVTFHMRAVHPGFAFILFYIFGYIIFTQKISLGCGGPANGLGYNSGGHYCGGWAGNCGDGGNGVSSWYLMCEVCREVYGRKGKKSDEEVNIKIKLVNIEDFLRNFFQKFRLLQFVKVLAKVFSDNIFTLTLPRKQRGEEETQSLVSKSKTICFYIWLNCINFKARNNFGS
jgi:hypothetical protein